jgi:hypothetical protein
MMLATNDFMSESQLLKTKLSVDLFVRDNAIDKIIVFVESWLVATAILNYNPL